MKKDKFVWWMDQTVVTTKEGWRYVFRTTGELFVMTGIMWKKLQWSVGNLDLLMVNIIS